MKLERRLFLLLGGAAAAFFCLLSVCSVFIVHQGFEEAEVALGLDKMALLTRRIEAEETALLHLAWDWGTWDETYAFLQGRRKNYGAANLSEGVLENLNVSTVCILDASGRIFRTFGANASDARAAVEAFAPGGTIPPSALRKGRAGLLAAPSGAVLAAASPVIRSDLSGVPRGLLIFLRPLAPGLLLDALLPGERLSLLPLYPSPLAEREGGFGDRFETEGFSAIRIGRTLPDPRGRPALRLSLLVPRPLTQAGLRTTWALLAATAAGFCLLSLMGGFILRRVFLGRLAELTSQVRRIGEAGDLSLSVGLEGGDELAELSLRIRGVLEGLREAQERAEAAGRAREEFFASVSHDFRTPLTAILGFSSLFRDRLDDTILPVAGVLPAKARSALERFRPQVDLVVAEALKLKGLIGDVLDLARLRLGVGALVFEELDFRALAEEVLAPFQPEAERRGLFLRLEGDSDAFLRGDRWALIRLLTNLISNALKYTRTGGVLLRLRSSPEGIRFEVVDTGIGIFPGRMKDLFRRYHRANPEAEEGTGLGLPICLAAVEGHGGSIVCSSRPGEGTSFGVFLPRKKGKGPFCSSDVPDLLDVPSGEKGRAAAGDLSTEVGDGPAPRRG
jgi:signal transduction histidine kinase